MIDIKVRNSERGRRAVGSTLQRRFKVTGRAEKKPTAYTHHSTMFIPVRVPGGQVVVVVMASFGVPLTQAKYDCSDGRAEETACHHRCQAASQTGISGWAASLGK